MRWKQILSLKSVCHRVLVFVLYYRAAQFGRRKQSPTWNSPAWLQVRTTVPWPTSPSPPSPWPPPRNLLPSVSKRPPNWVRGEPKVCQILTYHSATFSFYPLTWNVSSPERVSRATCRMWTVTVAPPETNPLSTQRSNKEPSNATEHCNKAFCNLEVQQQNSSG